VLAKVVPTASTGWGVGVVAGIEKVIGVATTELIIGNEETWGTVTERGVIPGSNGTKFPEMLET